MTASPSEPLLIKARYRSKPEEQVGAQLYAEGITAAYEGKRVPYEVPARSALYLPDFRVGNIILEVKGSFGHSAPIKYGNKYFVGVRDGASERKKLVNIRNSNPELDIRLVFQRPGARISKKSKTTYAEWAQAQGFKWCKGPPLPAEWIDDLRKEMQK